MLVLFLLAVVGATRVWLDGYQPYLNADPDAAVPPGGEWIHRRCLAVDWNKKPWTCPLCMGFLVSIPLYLCLLGDPWTSAPLYLFAGAAVASIYPDVQAYLRVGT